MLRVLVVDNEPGVAAALALVIKTCPLDGVQVEVSIAYDGDMALHVLRKDSYDIVMTDCNMRPVSGYELFIAIRQGRARQHGRGTSKDAVVCFVTEYSDWAVNEDLARLGPIKGRHFHVCKPADLLAIREAFQSAVQARLGASEGPT
jgi:CheY-like chemotaxis protein